MKKYIFLLTSFITIGCASRNISEEDKIYVTNELAVMREVDQIYAGVPSNEMKEKYGVEKAWELFKSNGDSVNLDNQNKAKNILNKFGFIGIKSFEKKLLIIFG